ncbi:MAG: hypothetical protein EXR75_14435 [Myxococcales bacterium]|nr:hypothetical protein [Myxococcales bacterium]
MPRHRKHGQAAHPAVLTLVSLAAALSLSACPTPPPAVPSGPPPEYESPREFVPANSVDHVEGAPVPAAPPSPQP